MTQSSPLNTFNFSWGSQQSHILNGLKTLAVGEITNVFLTDVILACEGHYIEAHRLVLSLCSSFFKELFNQNERISDKAHAIVILSHVSAVNLRYILQFMYQGSVQIPQEHVDGFLQTGSMLKVEGLMGATGVAVGLPDKSSQIRPSSSPAKNSPRSKKLPPTTKPRKRRRTSGSGAGSSWDNGCSIEANVKEEQQQPSFLAVTSVDNDDIADDPLYDVELVDDFGDAGGDSDCVRVGVSVDEGTTTSKPEPSTTKLETQKTLTPKNRKRGSSVGRQRDSDSSSSDDDHDDSSDSSSGSTEDYLDLLPERRPPRRLQYELTQTFETLEQAKAYIKSAKRWTTRYVRTLSGKEKKHVYDCVFKRECPAKMYLVEWETSVDLYISVEEHSHKMIKRKKYGLSDEVKTIINELYEKGTKMPHQLLLKLEEEGFKGLKNTQIACYINHNLKKKNN